METKKSGMPPAPPPIPKKPTTGHLAAPPPDEELLDYLAAGLDPRARPLSPPPIVERMPPPSRGRLASAVTPLSPVVSPLTTEETELLLQVRARGVLAFTRNTDLRELKDTASRGVMSPVMEREKYSRYGFSHEYGNIVFVMDRRFLAYVLSQGGTVVNPFLETFRIVSEGENQYSFKDVIETKEAGEALLTLMPYVRRVKNNCQLRTDGSGSVMGNYSRDRDDETSGDLPSFMGVYHQLSFAKPIPAEYIARVLIPEHLWIEAQKLCRGTPLQQKLQMVHSGMFENDFLEGLDKVAKRPGGRGGCQPYFGYNALRQFEQAYFRLITEDIFPPDATASQPELLICLPALTGLHRLLYHDTNWIVFGPHQGNSVVRQQKNDWKLFLNPRPDNFIQVLSATVAVLDRFAQQLGAGFIFKAPRNLDSYWQLSTKRSFSSDPTTPKLTIYANPETVVPLAAALEKEFRARGLSGWPQRHPRLKGPLGPSFALPYVDPLAIKAPSELIFAKHEGGNREEIARQAEREAKAGIIDDSALWEEKRSRLQADWQGPYAHVGTGQFDPFK